MHVEKRHIRTPFPRLDPRTTRLVLLIVLWIPALMSGQNCMVRNVTIIDTERGEAIPGMDVLIGAGLIQAVGKSQEIPQGSTVVDGSGKYLMPGMSDAHIHFFQSGGLYTRPDAIDLRHIVPYEKEKEFGLQNAEDYLRRYLRLGITTVIDVGGPMTNFMIRDSIAGTIISPNVLVTGPLFSMIGLSEYKEDPPIIEILNEKQADSLFQKMLPFKPDFIKIWYIAGPTIPAEQNYALVKYIARKTHEHGLKLTVHATELNTAKLAVQAGADILVHSVSDEIIPDDVIREWKTQNITYIPTLVVSAGYYRTFTGTLSYHPQDLAWANPFVYGTLTDLEGMPDEVPMRWRAARQRATRWEDFTVDKTSNANLVNLYRAGVNVATGTDAGNIGTMHASSYIQELEAMQKAGLTNAEILKASTINVAHGFGKDHLWGSIEKGKQADLILLKANPLESLQNLNSIEIVLKDGRILYADSIIRETPDEIVQRQVNAFNARKMEPFLSLYAEDVYIQDLNGGIIFKSKEALRLGHEDLFTNVSNLYYQVEERIVLENKVIDKLKLRRNDQITDRAVIYELGNGKITHVTWID